MRRRFSSLPLISFLFVLFLTLVFGAPDARAMGKHPLPPELKAPAPLFEAAVKTYSWIDRTRATPANGRARGAPSRRFKVDVIYPALAAPRRRPAIFFVHGLDSGRRDYDYLTHALARAGYVVVAADFPLTASSTKGGATDAHSNEQVRDLAFLADRLSAPDLTTEPWAPLVDPSRYLVVGHSTGGTVAVLAAFAPEFHDPRLAGAVALSPNACFFSRAFFATRRLPLAIIGATRDRYAPAANNADWAYAASNPPHALATLVGGYHVYDTDYCLPDWLATKLVPVDDRALIATMQPYGPGGAACPSPRVEAADPTLSCSHQHEIVRTLVLAFAGEMLDGDTDAVDALVGEHGPLRVEIQR